MMMRLKASKLLFLLRNPFDLNSSRFFSATRVARISTISDSFLCSAENRRFYSNSRCLLVKGSSEQIHTQTGSLAEEGYHYYSTKHPWPEWSKLLEKLREDGYFDRSGSSAHQHDEFLASEDITEEFLRAARACLLFARDHPDLLRTLSRRDIEFVVDSGYPFLFRNAVDSARRIEAFVYNYGSNELMFDRACTIDLMRFLLSYVCKPSSASDESSFSTQAVESSVRDLLSELTTSSRNFLGQGHSGSRGTQIPDNYEEKNEMKKGDWICPRCSFMNFSRNIECHDCDEARPKRMLSGGDWECPQCYFFNFAKNAFCLRCNSKRPVEVSFGTSGLSSGVGSFSVNNPNKAEIRSMLGANEKKAERWFSKVSQPDTAGDLSSSITDEDFPDIMPLRKGEKRFAVSTKKTPLEQRLANAQYRRNLGNDGNSEEVCFPYAGSGAGPDKTTQASITQTLDRILGRSSSVSEMNVANAAEHNRDIAGVGSKLLRNTYPQHGGKTEGHESYHVQVAPSSANIFAKPQKSKMEEDQMKDKHEPFAAQAKQSSMSGHHDALATPNMQEKAEECKARVPDHEAAVCSNPGKESQNAGTSGKSSHEGNAYNGYWKSTGSLTHKPADLQVNNSESWKSDSWQDSSGSTGSSTVQLENPNSKGSWNRGFSGKSLEGSAVKELDPSDMSEEAKAQRWFHRVAQIKDISELSQIPDEDFPQIMPMRKGVNRFVVSKRKTPLERRLTSPQYKRNLPIVKSNPEKEGK